ncbi:MAG: hypothetical protein IT259_13990 [Saprospiraceae bacterium]|nr:hypothetical protein [Saprospiraceae bacterium]
MRKKKLLSVVLLLILLFSAFSTYAEKQCECGDHATGITAYSVNGDDCCRSTPGANGFEYTYEQQLNGVWELTGTTLISGATAQGNCCNPS